MDNVVFFRVEATGVGDLVDQLGLLRREAKQLQKDMNAATDPALYTKLNRELENNKNQQKAIVTELKNVENAQKNAAKEAAKAAAEQAKEAEKLARQREKEAAQLEKLAQKQWSEYEKAAAKTAAAEARLAAQREREAQKEAERQAKIAAAANQPIGSYRALNAELVKLRQSYKLLTADERASEFGQKTVMRIQQLDQELRQVDASMGQFQRNVGNYPGGNRGLAAFGTLLQDAGGPIGNFVGGLESMQSPLNDIAASFGMTGSQALVATAGIAAAGIVVAKGVSAAMDYETAFAQLSATLGVSGAEADALKQRIDELQSISLSGGAQIVSTSAEIADAFTVVGSAAPQLLKNQEALQAVTKEVIVFSKSAGTDLAESARVVTGAINLFGLEASEAARVVNVLAAGEKEGSATTLEAAEALEKAGGAAKLSGINIEEATAAIQLLAKDSLKGSEAGTQLRNVFLKLATADALPPAAQEAFKSASIDVQKLTDTTVPLSEKLIELQKLNGKTAELTKIFGTENINAAISLIKYSDEFPTLTNAITNTNIAYDQAAVKQEAVQAKLQNLSNEVTNLFTRIGQTLLPAVSAFVDLLSKGAVPAMNLLVDVFSALTTGIDENKIAFAAAATAMITYAAATNGATIATKASEFATKAAALAQTILNNAIKAAPYVIIASAVFALTKVIMDYAYAAEEASVTTETIAESSERLGSALADSTAQLARETNEIRANFGVLKSETATREQKAEAIRALKKEYPDLLRAYSLEKGNLQDIEKAEKAIIQARAEKIAQKVAEGEIETLTKELIAANQELQQAQKVAGELQPIFDASTKRVQELADKGITGIAEFYLFGERWNRGTLEAQKDESDKALARAQERIAALQGRIKSVGESTQIIAVQLTDALKDVPVTAIKAGEDTGKNIVAGAIDGTQKELETVKEEQVRTLATLEAELAKYREQFAALNDKNLAPLNLINALENLPKEIASVKEKLKDLEFAEAGIKLVRFKRPDLEEEFEDRPLEIPVKPTVTPRTLAMVREELAKVQSEIQSFGNQDLVSTETIQRFESLTNEVERLERALASLNGTSDETAKATDEVAKDSEEQIKGIGRKRKVTREEIEEALIQASIDAAQAGADAIFEIENNNLERITEKKLAQLEQDEAAQLALVEGNAIAEQQVREDFQAQREQLEREAFEKKKQLDTAQAIMNAALAITQVFATTPWPLNLIAAAVVGVQTAAQIATIQAQEYALGGLIKPGEVVPKAESGIFVGPSHARGGINTRLSGRLVNVEGGEYYERLADGSSVVINKRSTSRFASALRAQAGKNYAGKLQALSAINEMGGGVPLYATGGLIAPMGNAAMDRQSTAQTELLAMALSKMESRVPVLTLQSFDTVNARANQVKTLQGL